MGRWDTDPYIINVGTRWKRSASRSARFTPEKRAAPPGTQQTGCWWNHETVWILWRRVTHLSLAGNRAPIAWSQFPGHNSEEDSFQFRELCLVVQWLQCHGLCRIRSSGSWVSKWFGPSNVVLVVQNRVILALHCLVVPSGSNGMRKVSRSFDGTLLSPSLSDVRISLVGYSSETRGCCRRVNPSRSRSGRFLSRSQYFLTRYLHEKLKTLRTV